MTPPEKRRQKIRWKQKICHTCEKEINGDEKYRTVRDHCHYTGKFRATSDSIGNLR